MLCEESLLGYKYKYTEKPYKNMIISFIKK